MVQNYELAKDILKKYNQEHLLNFYEELNNEEKQELINQICNINFQQILDLFEASKTDEVIPHNLIEPLEYDIKSNLSKDMISYYENIGKNALNKCCLVTLAGGQRY